MMNTALEKASGSTSNAKELYDGVARARFEGVRKANSAIIGLSLHNDETLGRGTRFAFGVLTSVLAMSLLANKSAGNNNSQRIVDELEKEVKLDRSRRAQVKQILDDARQKYKKMQKQNHPQLIEFRNATRARIGALLMPDQKVLYEEWIRKRDIKREQEFKASLGLGKR